MRIGRKVFAFVPVLAIVLLACGTPSTPGQPPPGYIDVPGSPDVVLNPGQQGSRGSTFSQQCNDANPDPPGPGEVGWHFILPQSVEEIERGLSPGNIFETLRVTFAIGGSVTLTVFGPPSDAHAYFTTPTDDVLLSGNADMFRELSLERGNEPFFNLSHTCAPAGEPTTTSSSTTTSPSTTTTTTAPTSTTGPTVTTSTTTPTLGPSTSISGGGSNTTSTADPGAGGGTTTLPAIPVTGSSDRRLSLAALFVLFLGIVLIVVARRPASS